jgi:hypothetical protein
MEDLFTCFNQAKQWLDGQPSLNNLTDWTKVGGSIERQMASSGNAMSCHITTSFAYGSACGNMAASNSVCWVLEVSFDLTRLNYSSAIDLVFS